MSGRHDPEGGCGLMILAAVALALVILFLVAVPGVPW